jgi:NACHT domain
LTGKTILCSRIIHSLKSGPATTVAYYFCDSHTDGRDYCGQILRVISIQILRAHLDLLPHVAASYANRGYNPSLPNLRRLITDLLTAIPSARVILDGLDECQEKDQKIILKELLSLCTLPDGRCKLLVSSRDVVPISKMLSRIPRISLEKNRAFVDADIRSVVSQSLIEVREKYDSDSDSIDDIEQIIVKKADGNDSEVPQYI